MLRIHHYYPRTANLGDHFVRDGIVQWFRAIRPDSDFSFFDINAKGRDASDFGLTRQAVRRANSDADLVTVGGSNLYEGTDAFGIHLERNCLDDLSVPLYLLGIGTGSDFLAPRPTRPGPLALEKIHDLHRHCAFSGVRDTLTCRWLQQLGIRDIHLTGDPVTFLFNKPYKPPLKGEFIAFVVPPVRYLRIRKRRFWDIRRPLLFSGLGSVIRDAASSRQEIMILCNDPRDLAVTQNLYGGYRGVRIACPAAPGEYYRILQSARYVVTGRLHSAILSFSLGIPFVLLDVDQRTRGFIETYGLESWSVRPGFFSTRAGLRNRIRRLNDPEAAQEWRGFIRLRDDRYRQTIALLAKCVQSLHESTLHP